jgi:hypothetical protein
MVEQLLSSPISFVHKPLALFIHWMCVENL